MELKSASDHKYIELTIAPDSTIPSEMRPEVQLGWSVMRLIEKHWQETDSLNDLSTGLLAGKCVDRLQLLLVKSFDAAMQRRSPFKGKKTVHWWNESIAELRRSIISACRRYQVLPEGGTQSSPGRSCRHIRDLQPSQERLEIDYQGSQEAS